MKAKAILAAGLMMAAAAVQSSAQTVYSVNAVGFVNLVIPNGFSINGNPLEAATNTISVLFPSVPNNSQIFKWSGSGFTNAGTYFFGWDNPNSTLVPGEAFFFKNTGATFTNTFVGNVKQGNLVTPLSVGFNFVASQVPQSGLLEADLKYVPGNNDQVFTFNSAGNSYNPASTYFFGWDSEPFIQVGQGFFVKRANPGSWSRSFSVNQ